MRDVIALSLIYDCKWISLMFVTVSAVHVYLYEGPKQIEMGLLRKFINSSAYVFFTRFAPGFATAALAALSGNECLCFSNDVCSAPNYERTSGTDSWLHDIDNKFWHRFAVTVLNARNFVS